MKKERTMHDRTTVVIDLMIMRAQKKKKSKKKRNRRATAVKPQNSKDLGFLLSLIQKAAV